MEYDKFVATPALAVERQRAWVAFMAAVIPQYAIVADATMFVDDMMAAWDKRFAPPPDSSKLGADCWTRFPTSPND
jgi:hypothetical protein